MIIPSIDLSEGKAVQLEQGRKKILERDNPLELAEEFARYGEVAVVDLDAAMGVGSNDPVIRGICRLAPCRVGGGIRSAERAAEVLSWGADKIIIGTMAFAKSGVNHEFLKELCSTVGRERIVIALDTLGGKVATEGWRKTTSFGWQKVIRELEPYASEFLFTTVDKEGLMRGPDFRPLPKLRAATALPITVAGGIATEDDVRKIAGLGFNAQLGMALYTGKLPLAGAFLSAVNWEKGLVPTVVQDAESQVLMLAYSNRQSLEKTLSSGKAWFYSRSRQKLWQKGETSGNSQDFVRIRTDCDGDALLLTVKPRGPACHFGSYACFGAKEFSLLELSKTIRDRLKNPPPGSYTAKLSPEAAQKKLREEVLEFLTAPNVENLVWEAADVLYFVQVILAQSGARWEDVMSELRRRRRTPVKPARKRKRKAQA
jgi:phosphoribosyl-ATP pyrophosphohydrolase/phosphoribosyl-AMP cyclohydrolase